MPRNLPQETLDIIAQKTGNEPTIILEVFWVDPTPTTPGTSVKYADKELPGVTGLILQLSNYSMMTKIGDVGNSGNISVVLNDSDGFIKALQDKFDINKRPCVVYQYFEGMTDISQAFILFNGIIASPIVWDEGERTFSFEVISSYNSGEVGFAPEQGQFRGVADDLIGRFWPLCFGSPIHVPATKVTDEVTGTLAQPFVIPDATLRYKLELVDYRINAVQQAYQLNLDLINEAINIIRPAYIVQEDYANKIVNYDHLRQTIEDASENIEKINIQIDTLISRINNAGNLENVNVLKANIADLKDIRDEQQKQLKGLYTQLHDIEEDFEAITLEAKNCKYRLTFINKTRQKCRDLVSQYFSLVALRSEIQDRILEQNQNTASSVLVFYGSEFPPGLQTVEINNNLMISEFSPLTNMMRLDRQIPKYTNISVTQTSGNEPTNINISGDYKVSGLYAWIRVVGFEYPLIVRITGQQGRTLTLDIPKKPKTQRTSEKDYDFNGNPRSRDAFQEGLGRLLTGIETDQQMEAIANQIPIEISPKIQKILLGNKNIINIQAKNNESTLTFNNGIDRTKSWYTLIYGSDEETEKIYFSDSSNTVLQKILNSTVSIDANNVSINDNSTPSLYWMELIVNNLMKPLRVLNWEWVDKVPKSKPKVFIKYNDEDPTTITLGFNRNCVTNPSSHLNISGTFDLIIEGNVFTFPWDISAGQMMSTIQASDIWTANEAIISGGQIKNQNFIITYNVPYRAVLWDTSNLKVEISPDATLTRLYDPATGPYFYFQVNGGGAFEYTRKERDKLINDEIEKDVESSKIKVFKEAIRKLLKKKAEAEDLETKNDLNTQILQKLNDFTAMIKTINQTNLTTQEAYRVISDKEYDLLYELEVTGYLEWVNNFRELDLQLEESDYIFTGSDVEQIMEVSKEIIPYWLNYINSINDPFKRLKYMEWLPDKTIGFYAFIGDKVSIYGAFQQRFIANILPSTIHAIHAYRTVQGVRRLVPVPSRYYTWVEANITDFLPLQPCVVSMVQPLNTLDNGWEEQIYVTLTSTVGPNVVDVIYWLIGSYSDLYIDNVSFTEVYNDNIFYPVSFALLERQELISLLEDICYQARISMRIINNKVYLRYLPKEPVPVKTITETDIEQGSLKLTYSETEEIFTKYIAEWQPHYGTDKPWSIVLRNNLKRYNNNTITRKFYIYNIRYLVYKSLTFWTILKAKSYKIAKFKLFLNHLDLDIEDCIVIQLNGNHLSNGPIKAIIQSISYNSDSHSLDVECWLPIIAGSMEKYKFTWPQNLTGSFYFPEDIELSSGNSGSPTGIYVPVNTPYTNYSPPELRPKDLGLSKVSDNGDSYPPNTASELKELDYDDSVTLEGLEMTDETEESGKNRNTDNNEWDLETTPQKEKRSKLQLDDVVFLGMGRVISKTGEENLSATDFVDTMPTVDVKRDIYQIALSNGKKISAVFEGFSRNIAIPEHTIVLVVFDKVKQEKIFYIPNFTSAEI